MKIQPQKGVIFLRSTAKGPALVVIDDNGVRQEELVSTLASTMLGAKYLLLVGEPTGNCPVHRAGSMLVYLPKTEPEAV